MAYTNKSYSGSALSTTLAASMAAGDMTFTVLDASSWIDIADGNSALGINGNFVVAVDYGGTSEEKILCSGISSNVVTVVTRGYDGSTATTHSSNAVCVPVVSAHDIDEANLAVYNTIGKVTTAGDLLYGSGANALTRLGIGAAQRVLTSSGTAPQWTAPVDVSFNNASNSSNSATAIGQLWYQTDTGELQIATATGTGGWKPITPPVPGQLTVIVDSGTKTISTSGFATIPFNNTWGSVLGGGMSFNSSTGVISITKSGVYRFTGLITTAANTSNYLYARFVVNNGTLAVNHGAAVAPHTPLGTGVNISADVEISATTTVYLQAYSTGTGATVQNVGIGALNNYFQATYLGPLA